MIELIFWNQQILKYFNLKRIAIGLNEEEQRLLDGLQKALENITDLM